MYNDLFDFIAASPSPFHAVAETALRLRQAGYRQLEETEHWQLDAAGRYFAIRGGTSLIAWQMPTEAGAGWRMAAAHSDSPAFKVKSASQRAGCTMLDTEAYGGMLRATWMDRPLGLAGRVVVRTAQGVEGRLIAPKADLAVMPSLAIHMDRAANDGHKYDLQKDTQALFGLSGTESYTSLLAKEANCAPEDILGADVQLYCRQPGTLTGPEGELTLCPRLDDLACAWAALTGFLAADGKGRGQGAVFCLFDSEEVGSGTAQGACGSFLPDVLARAGEALGESRDARRRALANSLLLSADNGHAIHPNHAEMSDPSHPVRLGGGVGLKFNASQKYTTTGLTAGLFHCLCEKAGVPVQEYYNRPDLPGGSTLGNLLSAQVSVPMLDIGLPQLAMHSCVETAATADLTHLAAVCESWYKAFIAPTGGGSYEVRL